MQTLREFLEKNINKLVGELNSEDELKKTLKTKLTKKEYKLFVFLKDEEDKTVIQKALSIDDKRYDELTRQTIKKINQEKLKQLLIRTK